MTTKAKPTTASTCPRCESGMRMGHHEPECIVCGFVDYEYVPPKRVREIARINEPSTASVFAGTNHRARYVGDAEAITDLLAIINVRKTVKSGGRKGHMVGGKFIPVTKIVDVVSCPFCFERMAPTGSLNNRAKQRIGDAKAQRFACSQGHLITLLTDKNSNWGWK